MSKGDKVLVRVMECTNKKFDNWEVIYKTGVITQENIISSSSKSLYVVRFTNGEVDYAWSEHILDYPHEWA
jgi:hypothetical protein